MTNSEKERLLCYAAGILGSTLANPGNVYGAEQLIGTSIRAANKMIQTIFNDEELKNVLEQRS